MPRTSLTVSQIVFDGLAEPAEADSDATNGMTLPANDGRMFVRVRNSDASAHNVTVLIPTTYFGHTIADDVIAIPASSVVYIGPWETNVYNQLDGAVYIDPAVDTLLKLIAMRL